MAGELPIEYVIIQEVKYMEGSVKPWELYDGIDREWWVDWIALVIQAEHEARELRTAFKNSWQHLTA